MRCLLLIGLVVTIAATGCFPTGAPTYPFDIYPELHYSQGYRPQEPPRLDPPDGAVPITGRAPQVQLEQAAQLQNPLPATPENQQRGAELYRVNCAPCHGPQGRGDGFVAKGGYFQQANLNQPVDFASDRVRGRTDGQLYANISNGIGGMPAFRKLLTAEERWLLVQYVRAVGGR